MALNISKIRNERKKAFREIGAAIRTVDTNVEITQRYLQQKIRLKEKIISIDDLEGVLTRIGDTERAIQAAVRVIAAQRGIFSI